MDVAACSYANFINNNISDLLWVTKCGNNPTDVCFVCMWESCYQQCNETEQLSEHLNAHLLHYENTAHLSKFYIEIFIFN